MIEVFQLRGVEIDVNELVDEVCKRMLPMTAKISSLRSENIQ
jgi:hypothetical protein